MKLDKSLIYPLFIPMQGCPGRCVYCDQSKISGAGAFDLEAARDEVRAFIRRNPARDKEVAFYGGSFTAFSEAERELILGKIGEELDEYSSFRISTHPLFISDDILEHCARHRVRTIELGIQDWHDAVLEASGRGYSSEQARLACQQIREHGFRLGIQLMPGLPGSNASTTTQNQEILLMIKPDYLRLYPLVVIKDTPLAIQYLSGRYTPLSLKEAIRICADYAELCRETGIKIIKYGIPSNIADSEVLCGPYHPAFGELVKQEILIREICRNTQPKANLEPKQLQLLRAHGCRFLEEIKHGNCLDDKCSTIS